MLRRHGLTALGLLLLVVGVGLYVVARPAGPTDFGWFAYTPLGGDVTATGTSMASTLDISFDSSSELVFLTRDRLVAIGVLALGLLVLTSALAYRAGRRRAVPT